MISFGPTEEQDLIRADRARVRAKASCARSRERATRSSSCPTTCCSRAGSSAWSRAQIPEAYGGGGIGALAGDRTRSCSRSSPAATLRSRCRGADAGALRHAAARPRHRGAEADATCRSSAADVPRRVAGARSSRAHVRRAAACAPPRSRKGNGFVLTGTKRLRAARGDARATSSSSRAARATDSRARGLHRAARRRGALDRERARAHLGLRALPPPRSSSTRVEVPANAASAATTGIDVRAPASNSLRAASRALAGRPRARRDGATRSRTPRSASPSARRSRRSRRSPSCWPRCRSRSNSMRWTWSGRRRASSSTASTRRARRTSRAPT